MKKERDYFVVKREVFKGNFDKYERLAKNQQTQHFVERNNRVESYNKLGLLEIDFKYGFIVDKNHPNGDEMHFFNSKGIIYIMNCRTGKLITVLAARPGQIKRYFEELKLDITEDVQELVDKALSNQMNGYNYL